MRLVAVPMFQREALEFIANFHRHNDPPAGTIVCVGVSDGVELWGVATVGRPVGPKLQDGQTCEVTRVCVRDGAPKGSNSFLYARCWDAMRALGYTRMVTYTLTSESGASLKGAGWKPMAQTPAWAVGKGWTNRPGRRWQPVHGQTKMRWEPPREPEVPVREIKAAAKV